MFVHTETCEYAMIPDVFIETREEFPETGSESQLVKHVFVDTRTETFHSVTF